MLASVVRTALATASPAGAAGRLSVLIYHRVMESADPLLPGEPSAAEFEATMRWVKRTFNVIPMADGALGLKDGRLPPRALSITFDDGYANNASIAAPILERLGLHATFFVATGFLDGGRMFNDTVIEAVRAHRGAELDLEPLGLSRYVTRTTEDKVRCIDAVLRAIKYEAAGHREELAERIAERAAARPPTNLMMSSEQVAALASRGFAVGGHTATHPILARLPIERARDEIDRGRRRLEALSGKRVSLFAYPNGRPDHDYTMATVELVRDAGFDAAVCTSAGAARVGSDVYQIPRFTPWDKRRPAFAARMWSNLTRTAPVRATA